MHAYCEDLAFIHESGHTQFAEGAAALLLELLPAPTGACCRVVDLGCGGGTLAAQLDAAGFDVLGYDISESMVALARARVPRAKFVLGSFVDVELPRCLAVTAIGEIVNYLFDDRNSDAVLRGLLERIHAALVPGGVLVFDVAGRQRDQSQPQQQFRNDADWSVLVRSSLQGDVLTREITSYRRVGELYRRNEEIHRLRLLDPEQITGLLDEIGFAVEPTSTYAGVALPAGLHGLIARKGLPLAADATDQDAP